MLVAIGRFFFGLGIIGIGVTHFVFGQFAIGRAPAWPASIPGGLVWAYVSGAIVIAVGIAILVQRQSRPAALLAGALVFLWALLRHIPVVAGAEFLAGPWTPAGKALTFVGAMLAVAATSQPMVWKRDTPFTRLLNDRESFVAVGRVCLAVFFLIAGAQHFKYLPFVATLMPAWFPGDPLFWSRFGGVALLAGGFGLLIPRIAPLAALASGLMVFSWVWIIHVPRIFVSVSDGIAVFEALAFSGLALLIAGSPWRQSGHETRAQAPRGGS
jgi:uncharacterized membrane protein